MRFSRNYWPQKGHCFVIMPFGKKPLRDGKEFDWDAHYELVIKLTVEAMGMTPVRADEIYGSQPLMDRVWRGIQEAEVVVADLTGRSPNVLYEVGLAHVIGKRILILTMYGDDVPADLGEFVQIRYSTEGVALLQLTRDLTKNLTASRAEPAAEAMLSPLPGGGVEPITATVLSVTKDFATIEAQDGRRGFLNAEDFSWTRRKADLTRLVKIGQRLDGAFIVDTKGQPRYSLAAVEDNPWPRLENDFPIGKSFRGVVGGRRQGVGAFVAMRHGIDGLVPESHIPKGTPLTEGTEVEAVPVRIDLQQREVELRLVRALEPSMPHRARSVGLRIEGKLAHLSYEKGFVLVDLDESSTGLLPATKMLPSLFERFNAKSLQIGEPVSVEIVAIDQQRNKITLRQANSGINPQLT